MKLEEFVKKICELREIYGAITVRCITGFCLGYFANTAKSILEKGYLTALELEMLRKGLLLSVGLSYLADKDMGLLELKRCEKYLALLSEESIEKLYSDVEEQIVEIVKLLKKS